MSKEQKRLVVIGVAVLVVLVSLWVYAYTHTSEGAKFGCWPEPWPKWVPQVIRDWLDLYCGA